MVDRTLAGSLGLKGDWDLGEDNWKDDMDANLVKLSVLGQPIVLDTVSATPGAPTEGDIYLFDETHPTQANDIAVYDEGAWVYYTPEEGWEVYDQANDMRKRFDGALWAEAGGGSASYPDFTGNAGKVLAVNGTEDGVEWIDQAAGGGGGSNFVKLDEVELGSAAASIDFSSIDQNYDDLVVVLVARGDTAAGSIDVSLRFNGDTGANYDYQTSHAYASGTAFGQAVGQTSGRVAQCSAASAPAGVAGSAVIDINRYADTTFNKTARGQWGNKNGTGGFSQGNGRYSVQWRNSAAINQITIIPSAGNFDTGTKAVLYGRGGTPAAPAVPDMELLAEHVVVGSAEATISFASIPQTHKDLLILAECRTTAGANNYFSLQANGDTSSVYFFYLENRFGTSSTTTTSARCGTMTDSAAGANFFSPNKIEIFSYSDGSRGKVFTNRGHYLNEAFEDKGGGVIGVTAAITDLLFIPVSGNFEIGTRFRVYGMGAL